MSGAAGRPAEVLRERGSVGVEVGTAGHVIDIATQPSFDAGKPRILFEGRYERTPATGPNYDISPDGQRFLMLKPSEQEAAAPTQINVVLNWFEELKRRVPTGQK
jgi:hypothetical protein